MSSQDDFLKELRSIFMIEAGEHLQVISKGLLDLELARSFDGWQPIVEKIFRAAHSLKGAARAVDLTEAEISCQALEDTFAIWKRQITPPPRSAVDVAHRTLDSITAAIAAPKAEPEEELVAAPAPPAPAPAIAPPPSPAPAEVSRPTPVAAEAHTTDRAGEQTIRIAVSKLDARLVEAEEMLSVKMAASQRAVDLRGVADRLETWRKEWSAVEPEARALRRLLERQELTTGHGPAPRGLARLLRFVDWNADYGRLLENEVSSLVRTAQQDRTVAGRLVDELLEDSKKLLLLPFSTLAAPFPKLVRDLCRDQGKEATLIIRGEDVEIDKRILEEMKDPLIHLLRNSVDHGVEPPEVRTRLGKPERATITMTASQLDGSKVQILLTDDGAGLDLARIRETAVKRGLISAIEARELGDAETRALIFMPEVSTSPIITRISGRGLGLAIAQENAEKLGGTIVVESEPGKGTTFRIQMPAVRATFRGVLVQAGGNPFIIPTMLVERVIRIKPEEVQTVENRETIVLGGCTISLVRLSDALGLKASSKKPQEVPVIPAILLGAGDQRIAFAVEAVLDEREVLVKPLRKPLSRVRNIAAATVLSSGQVAPILNVADLLKSARKSGVGSIRPGTRKPAGDKTRSILVAEDSITSRMLIKSILEGGGYTVKTAVDGAEAFAMLRTERFDAVVSDVEMPRLNGFALTAKIRADKSLEELPVILVTALETREDRERGIDAGANAYLVKSNFDQSNLLEAVRRLI